ACRYAPSSARPKARGATVCSCALACAARAAARAAPPAIPARARVEGSRRSPRTSGRRDGGVRRRCRTHAAACLLDQVIADGDIRLRFGSPGVERGLPYGELPMRARAALEDPARVLDVVHASERFGVLADELEQLLEELRERHDLAAAEVDQALIEAVTHRTPAVLAYEHRRVRAPTLIPAAQAPEHPQHRHDERGETQRVVDVRANVHDARLERRIARARPEIPPDLRRVLDDARLGHHADEAAKFREAREALRNAGARQAVEDRETERLEPRVDALPQRRRA